MATFDPTGPEVWYPVPGFTSYEISSHLRLRSYHLGPQRRSRAPRIIQIHKDDRGYGKLILWKDKKYHNLYLHRVVAELAFGPCPAGQYVRHLDDDKSNNWPSNLAYGSGVDNMSDAKRNDRMNPAKGEDAGNSRLTETCVKAIRYLHALGIDRVCLGACFGLSTAGLRNVITGERWSHVERPEDLPSEDFGKPSCIIPGCDRIVRAHGMCQAHYLAARRRKKQGQINSISEFVEIAK